VIVCIVSVMIIMFYFFLDVQLCKSLPMYQATRRHLRDKRSLCVYVHINKTLWCGINKTLWCLLTTYIQEINQYRLAYMCTSCTLNVSVYIIISVFIISNHVQEFKVNVKEPYTIIISCEISQDSAHLFYLHFKFLCVRMINIQKHRNM